MELETFCEFLSHLGHTEGDYAARITHQMIGHFLYEARDRALSDHDFDDYKRLVDLQKRIDKTSSLARANAK